MARPTSAKTQMSYTKLMELDDYEETAGPPSKKSLFFVKDPHKDSLCKVRGDPMSSHPIREQRQAAASEQQSFVLNADGISQTERPGEDIDYQPKCTPATSKPVLSQRTLPVTHWLPRPSPLSPTGGRPPKRNPSDSTMKSPGPGLRLGLSRLAKVKPLHPTTTGSKIHFTKTGILPPPPSPPRELVRCLKKFNKRNILS
ncbi:RAD51-associated protein 1 isoform X2 [Esox lucius]|uniref:RAD51-associated protein 1 isoform X2 n=1 Tax=Esox lucius TaxID=8010 RepID=UPI00097334B8|nr:RAD51-associated protein 1 isoform X2 [Esox lucius]